MADARLIGLKDHPRASAAIGRAKAYGGLGGFAFVVLLGLSNGAGFAAIVERALMGGIVGYLAMWAASVAVWKRVLVAEVTAAARRARERASSEVE